MKTLIIILIAISSIAAQSQTFINKGEKIGDEQKLEAITNISKILNENYVFPDKANEMGTLIQQKLNSNEYDKISDPMLFSEQLTKDLQSVSKDKHLRVMYNPKEALELSKSSASHKMKEEVDENTIQMMEYENYGFKKIERLNGNIGYIDFRNFYPSQYSKSTVAAVMGFLANCDAIIIDLRQNGGGDPDGVRLICSYFFDANPVHLNDLYNRPENKMEEFWTLKEVEGKRMPDVGLYVLTSNYTFSGAEEFAYNLKNLKRATIVGETTGGGAHPGDVMAVNSNYVMFVPNGRAINPITKTNWEGTGVTPDLEVPQDKALEIARMLALENLAKKTTHVEIKNKLEWDIETIKSAINPVSIDETSMTSFTGKYGERNITVENGALYYQRTGRPKFKMIPMSDNKFMFKEMEAFRIEFVRDANGIINQLIGIYDNGQRDISEKVN